MKRLQDIAEYVDERISSTEIELSDYVTTDCLLQNKNGRTIASNLPPVKCNLIKYQKNDILIANIRPYLKKIWYADRQGGASADVLVFRAKTSIDPLYLYAVFLQDSFYDYVMRATKGSKMPRGDKNHIMNYIIHPVSGAEEKRIGQIISNINTKIELNKKISRELEAMAKELYDYWFVQFEFPNEQGKPYKSSGGKMVWNEQLKREIPKGWKVTNIGNLTTVVTGKEDANFSSPNGKYKFFTCSQEALLCDTPAFSGQAVLIAGNGDFNVKHYSGEFNAYQRTYVLIPENQAYYGAMYISAKNQIQAFKNGSNGSIVKFITKGDVENIPFILPNDDSIFYQINKLIEKIELCERENEELTKLRDWLLPMLMNGQARVE